MIEERQPISPEVSVVIPSRNGASTIVKQLQSIMTQKTDARFEVIVADNGSTDGTREVVEELRVDNVRCVDAGRAAGINVARNEGIRASRGRLILLCDDDDQVAEGWIQAYWTSGWEESLVAGPLDLLDGAGRHTGTVQGPYRMSDAVPHHAVGCNCGFDRRVFDAIGGFDEGIAGGSDETDFFWRAADAGFETKYVHDARVWYRLRSGIRQIIKQGRSYGRGFELLMDRHPDRVPHVGFSIPALLRMMVRGCIGAFDSSSYERYSALRKIGFSYGTMEFRSRRLVTRLAQPRRSAN